MGSFIGIFLKDNARKPNIPEDKKEEFLDRAVKLLNAGGMMKMDKISILGIDIVSFKKLRREDAEDGRLVWHYNYFENDFWEWAGIDFKEGYLWSNKVGYGKFAIAMMAAYVLESLYTEDSAAVDYNGQILGETSQTGWINYLFDAPFEMHDESLQSEEEFDNLLVQIALERMKHFDPDTLIPQEEINREFGLSPDDYVDPEELVFDE